MHSSLNCMSKNVTPSWLGSDRISITIANCTLRGLSLAKLTTAGRKDLLSLSIPIASLADSNLTESQAKVTALRQVLQELWHSLRNLQHTTLEGCSPHFVYHEVAECELARNQMGTKSHTLSCCAVLCSAVLCCAVVLCCVLL